MAKYVSLIALPENGRDEAEVASLFRNLGTDIQEYDAHIDQCYAVLGEYDFMVVVDAPDRNAAFRASIAIENQGLDTQTMEIIPIEEFSSLVPG